jgi:hypothetical protein
MTEASTKYSIAHGLLTVQVEKPSQICFRLIVETNSTSDSKIETWTLNINISCSCPQLAEHSYTLSACSTGKHNRETLTNHTTTRDSQSHKTHFSTLPIENHGGSEYSSTPTYLALHRSKSGPCKFLVCVSLSFSLVGTQTNLIISASFNSRANFTFVSI